jgi:hypothetical protein
MQAANLAALEKGKKGGNKKKDALSTFLNAQAPQPSVNTQLKEQEKSFYNGMPSSGPQSPSRKSGGLQRVGSQESPEHGASGE